ncbi:MAG: insulinase family protein [Candidatus Zixiibacteriota bacterium]|nr:MAG: insulinase family protein [candidate division Zixibacteria bacterium]
METREVQLIDQSPKSSKERIVERRILRAVFACVMMIFAATVPAVGQTIDAREYKLDNGMQVLMVERHDAPTVMAAILARVGSANEEPGITGISHLFEHMMFKGTETIGTTDIKRDLEVMAELDSLRVLMRDEERIMREELRRGKIKDMLDPLAKTARYREIEAVFDSLILEERKLIIKDQLDELYTKNGGYFLNAFTSQDMTGYFVRLPKNKMELYMWLESDRFSHPVFREFYSERDVVREERRLSLESTPTGLIEEDFSAMFWKSSSYHWEVLGWPSDLGSITREQADSYFSTYYAPNNLTMLLVGDLNPDEMIKMIKKYFERIPRGKTPPPDVVTLEEAQYGEKRMIAEAETSPKAEIWYHTVAWKHSDSYPLDVLGGIMGGKTGRLYKKLVEEKGIAKSSSGGGGRMMGGGGQAVDAGQDSRKYAGAFEISAEGVSGTKPEQLEAAIYEVIEDLQKNPVPADELQKVKNQLRVQSIRAIDFMSGMGILFVLGQNAALGDWTETNNGPKMDDLVTAADIQRVANTYFAKNQRNVLLIDTKAESAAGGEQGEDPQLAQAVQMIKSVKDPARLEKMIVMFSMQLDNVKDPNEKSQMEKLLKIANEHLKEPKAAKDK